MSAIDTALQPRIRKIRTSSQAHPWRTALSWLLTWEIYPILFCATFLHFYVLSATQFDADQAILWRLPRAAVLHGLIPATGTIASIGLINPPGYVYLLMPLAAFTANPFADVIFTALLNIFAVILAYAFTRCYFGRVAGTVVALLYATTFEAVFFGRFIWQPNLLPLFVILFMWTLFRGTVERKPGWFALALPLLGFMLQMHATPVYLVIPLVLALALAYKTVRWRDVIIGLLFFSLMFSTYLIWEASTHFADISVLLGASGGQAHIDTLAFRYYEDFFAPYVTLPTNPVAMPTGSQSLLLHLMRLLHLERWAMYCVVLGGFLVAILGLFGWKRIQLMDHRRFPEEEYAASLTSRTLSFWQKIWHGWRTIAASPQRCGLLLLLAWQIPPLLLLSRHTVALQPHYFLFLLPGPFILVGLLFSQVIVWSSQANDLKRLARYTVPVVAALLIVLQFTGSFSWFFDESHGAIFHGNTYDTWQDVQGAVNAADHLAQIRHLQHVYIDTDTNTYETLKYLAGQMQTPATVFNGSNCLVLPALSQGPVVMLLGPADTLDNALLNRFASATLVSEPPRLGGAPFRLYVVQPLLATPDSQRSFVHTLTLDTKQPGSLLWSDPAQGNGPTTRFYETHWINLKNLPAADGTTYTYHFDVRYSSNGTGSQTSSAECSFTSLKPGDQLLVPFPLSMNSTTLPTSFTLSGSSWVTQPDDLRYGPFSFESILEQSSTPVLFQATSGEKYIIVQS